MSRDPLNEDAVYKIKTLKIDLNLNELPSWTMSVSKCKLLLTPKHGKGSLTRVVNTYQQSLER